MQCRNVLTRIDALRTGELEKNEGRRVEEHLERCPSCNESVVDIESFASAVKALKARPPRSVLKNLQEELNDQFDVVSAGEERAWVAFSDRGIRMIDLGSASPAEFQRKYETKFHRDVRSGALPDRYRRQVVAALEGKAPTSPEVDLRDLSSFEREVLQTIVRIPRGEVRPYAWVARQVGRPKAARAIGNVMARNPVPLLLPCHRVVPTSGGVGNYGYGPAKKRAFLEREGLSLEQYDELSRKGARYVGSMTTHIFCFPSCRDAERIREGNLVPLRSEREARRRGFRPCQRCQPAA